MDCDDSIMSIYEVVALNIKHYLNKLENNSEFKKECPNLTAFEYLSESTKISTKRLKNIIDGNARTKVDELYRIAIVLGVKIDDIIKRNKN